MTDKPKEEPLKHKRRVRYQGTHPKQFKDKYKEHNFEKYPEDVAKIIESGKTPAGTHRPICVNEILNIIKPMPGQIGLDATLGFGGHAIELLKRIQPKGCLFATDVDPIEIKRTEKRLRGLGFTEEELLIRRSNFAGVSKFLAEVPQGFAFIVADLGISSMQLDNPDRGFTFKREGPLDLRLNPQRGQSAAALIRSRTVEQLEILFFKNSDEPHAAKIAKAVFKHRLSIEKTTDLAHVIANAFGHKQYTECNKEQTTSIRRVFQALRIEVNDEFSALDQFLRNLPMCLKSQGRVAILSFHSGEDNRVFESLKKGFKANIYSEISFEPIRPHADEIYSNPRSKSALLRWAIKK